MKKTSKILSGSLLVALMSIGLVTKVDVKHDDHHLEVRDVLAEDVTKDVTGKVVRRALNDEASNPNGVLSEVKAQVSAEAEGKRSIRFVAGIDSYNYDNVEVSVLVDGVEKFNALLTTAYERIVEAGVEKTAAEAFGEGYNYLVAYTVNNVPSSAWNAKFDVDLKFTYGDEEKSTQTSESKTIQGLVDMDQELKEITLELTNSLTHKNGGYNCELADTDYMPEGASSAKVITSIVPEGNTNQISSGVVADFSLVDLSTGKIRFYAKAENIYKDRVGVTLYDKDLVKITGSDKNIVITENATGVTSENIGDGWYLVNINIAEVWDADSYEAKRIRISFANLKENVTVPGVVYIADLSITYSGASEEPKDEVEIPLYEDTTVFTGDLSDTLQVGYNCNVAIDNQVSHDGNQSAKISADGDTWFEAKTYPRQNLGGCYISFYVKLDGDSIVGNNVYVVFEYQNLKDSSNNAIRLQVEVDLQSPQNGIVVEDADANGWYKVIVNCTEVGADEDDTRKLSIKAGCADDVAKDGIFWVDELYYSR